MILAGDVGGTKTNVGWFRFEDGALRTLRVERFSSREHPSLESILHALVESERHAVEAACFGVAGPVVEGRVEATNLPWVVEAEGLARELGLGRVELVNDLYATAEGLEVLGEEQVETLWAGAPVPGAAELLVAAGTGLGVALRMPLDAELVSFPSEAGHADFAPRDDEEAGFLRFLSERFGHVSVERVVSGPGIVHAYDYLGTRGFAADGEEFEARREREDVARLVSEYALAGRSARATRALQLFLSAYGAAAGNLALACLALGGVWLAGGIPPKLAPLLRRGVFRDAFVAKGRFRELLEPVPIRLVHEPRTALLGAARHAAKTLAAGRGAGRR